MVENSGGKAEYVVSNHAYSARFPDLKSALEHASFRARRRTKAGINPAQDCAIYKAGTAPVYTPKPISFPVVKLPVLMISLQVNHRI